MLTKQEVEHIAKLARLELSQSEVKKIQKELSSILDYIDQLKKAAISGVQPTSHSIFIENVMREDKLIARKLESKRKLIEKFPAAKGGYLKTKSIL